MPAVYVVEAYHILPTVTLTWYKLFSTQEAANNLLQKYVEESDGSVLLGYGELNIYKDGTHIRTYRIVQAEVHNEESAC